MRWDMLHLEDGFGLGFSLSNAVGDKRSEHVPFDLLMWAESFCNYLFSNPNKKVLVKSMEYQIEGYARLLTPLTCPCQQYLFL
jgi:hypothetical protein